MLFTTESFSEKYPMLTPLEQAIMYTIPEDSRMYFRYSDLNMDKSFMKTIKERRLTTGDVKLTHLIRHNEAPEALERFLEIIEYNNGKSSYLKGCLELHAYIFINLCFASKARETLLTFLDHPFISGISTEMLKTGKFFDIRGSTNAFKYVDPSDPMFEAVIMEGPKLMDKICTNPIRTRQFFETLVYGSIEGRHYDGIKRLMQLNPGLTMEVLSKTVNLTKGKPESFFMKLCLYGYYIDGLLTAIDHMKVTDLSSNIGLVKLIIDTDSLSAEERIFIQNAYANYLSSEALALLINRHKNDNLAKVIQSITGWNEPFIGHPLNENSFTADEESVLKMAVKTNDPLKIMELFDFHGSITEDRVYCAFIECVKYNADKCLRCLSIHSEISGIIDRLLVAYILYKPKGQTLDCYGSVVNLGSEMRIPNDLGLSPLLMYVSAHTPVFTQLYISSRVIEKIPDYLKNPFRFSLTMGAIINLNTDLYDWSISELYDGNETWFLLDLFRYLGAVYMSIDSVIEHQFMGIFKAFKLYLKSMEFIDENSL